jgi:cell division protein FtsW
MLLVVGVMVLAAGLHYGYVAAAGLLAVVLGAIAVVAEPYRWRRIIAFLDPWADPNGAGYQIIQSLIAVGSGGWLGRGLMGGVQKLFFLPEPHTDFIFAVISEELGFIGATLVVACFGVIGWRGLRAATAAPDRFGAFLALGITAMVVAQAMINLSVVLGLMPTKGISLPLVSSGGSSLLVNLAAMGVLLNISQHAVHDGAAVEQGAA